MRYKQVMNELLFKPKDVKLFPATQSQISIIDEYVPDEYEYDDVCSEYESDDDKFYYD